MDKPLAKPHPGPLLDDQAVTAFVAEIRHPIDNVAAAVVYSSNGRLLWQREYRDNTLDVASSLSLTPPAEPGKRLLGQNYCAFDFPLKPASEEPHTFTLIVDTMDPPSLASVTLAAKDMLSCIARQIDLDAALETGTINVRCLRGTDPIRRHLEEIETDGSPSSVLQNIVDMCFAECEIDCFAAVFPDSNTRAVACKPSFDATIIDLMVEQLQKRLLEKRRVVTATITTENGVERHVTCAPVYRQRKLILGMVVIIAESNEPSHAKIVRAVADKLSKTQASRRAKGKFLARPELLTQIDGILTSDSDSFHSLIYFDADKMHAVNDSFGYSGGDRVLKIIRRIVADSSGANDVVAHLGGDRFAMFMPGASGDTAVAKAEQVLQLLAQETIDDGARSIKLSASCGVVDTAEARNGAEDMLVLAEVASRGAQERGGNQCARFQDIDSSIIQRRSDVDRVGFLQMALLENKFSLHAQEIASLNGESGQKYELLVRMDDENHPDSSPAQFLSAAERYQLMSALDRWVINSALTSIASTTNVMEIGLSTFCINVAAQSLQDDSLVDYIESRIAETGVPPDSLCFEITETTLVRNIEKAQSFVHRLQRLGCLVALDDFGTGYSSFAYLKTLPVNYLKIDGSFVRDVLENELSKTIVRAVVEIAKVIGAQTVAEHVENTLVRAWLKDAGIHYVQGFAIHRPEPFEGILTSIDEMSSVFDDDSERIDLSAQTVVRSVPSRILRMLKE
ncbi:MAG: bifunctional diguanylate cyclase/phosphodiesterase [Gammaproteobacteria bacterium]|nr:bifunctional diguanylate cyclase/phosphodiesterase [Gammaproteobacteria bacterium]